MSNKTKKKLQRRKTMMTVKIVTETTIVITEQKALNAVSQRCIHPCVV